MQLTVEIVVSLVSSAAVGATVAWLGNRVVNAELLAHVKRHCSEIDEVKGSLLRHNESVGDSFRRAHERINDHAERLRVIEYQHTLDQRDRPPTVSRTS